jgi:UDP-N-acetylmuramoylalanine--D-glutamate ligase
MRVLVIGLGATGEAVAEDARAHGGLVAVVEDHPQGDRYEARAKRAIALGAEVLEAPSAATVQARARVADLVVPSPGVRPDHAAIVAAVGASVPVRSEVDVAVERLRAATPRPRIVAVTGTNGKTTVTTMIAAMCREGGLRSVAVGNIGPPIIASGATDADVVVAEVSTFQLEFTTDAFVPDVAVLLNVAQDHIDWHDTVEAYAAAKARVFAHQREHDVLVVNADDAVAWDLARSAPSRVVAYSTKEPGPHAYCVRDGSLLGPDGVIAPVPSARAAHDVSNALAAAASAIEVGVDAAAIARTLGGWTGLPHRVESVATVDGVQYVDDSKATNGHAAASALEGFERVVLIAGGRDRSRDLGLLRRHAPKVRAVVAIGESAANVAAVFEGAVPVEHAASMHDAVRAAAARACAGDTVLLSPGCASLDWYESYAARGDDFAREVELLARETHRRGTEPAPRSGTEPA